MLLPLPEPEGALDADAAALEAHLAEPFESGGGIALLGQEVGEHDRILHRHSRPGGHVRGGRVERVADQEHPPAMPGRRYEDRVERTAVDPGKVVHLGVPAPSDHAPSCSAVRSSSRWKSERMIPPAAGSSDPAMGG